MVEALLCVEVVSNHRTYAEHRPWNCTKPKHHNKFLTRLHTEESASLLFIVVDGSESEEEEEDDDDGSATDFLPPAESCSFIYMSALF